MRGKAEAAAVKAFVSDPSSNWVDASTWVPEPNDGSPEAKVVITGLGP